MNTYARNMNSTKRAKKRTRQSGSNSGSMALTTIIILSFITVVIFTIFYKRVSYNEGIETLNRNAVRIKREIHKLDREIANLRIEREKLSNWPNVSRKIRQFGLGLRPPTPRQVKRMVLIEHLRERKSTSYNAMVVSQR